MVFIVSVRVLSDCVAGCNVNRVIRLRLNTVTRISSFHNLFILIQRLIGPGFVEV